MMSIIVEPDPRPSQADEAAWADTLLHGKDLRERPKWSRLAQVKEKEGINRSELCSRTLADLPTGPELGKWVA